jgi:Ni,Fe-hydrogenase III large subunit
MHAHTGVLRELTLRAADHAFGHRLMMDCVTPGGVLVDLDRDRRTALRELTTTIRDKFPRLVELYDNTASLQDRTVGAGRLDSELAQRFGCGGVIGRASGRDFDARRDHSYSPYDELRFETPVWREGDVNARVWVRIREVEESLR